MPELPEVQTVIDTLRPLVLHKTIEGIEIVYEPIVENELSDFLNRVSQRQVIALSRKGKFIIVHLDQGYLIIHLRMEGKFFVTEVENPWVTDKHTHARFYLDDGFVWTYHDVRKFGRIAYVEQLTDHQGLNRLGYDVFDEHLEASYLFERAKNRSLEIKNFLLDQQVMAGVGNIYANEILFDAKVSPFQPSNTLKKAEFEVILKSTRHILSLALHQGGTSIRSYTSSLGVTGLFQQSLRVHGKQGLPCECCGHRIKRQKQAGRSSFYCPVCQPLRQRKARKK